jgi:hypothetical protein
MRYTLMSMKKPPMPMLMACWIRASIAIAAAALASSALWMPAHAADEATRADTANCIALMQANADELARQIKAGDTARESELRTELTRAGALIARTYLDGLHDSDEAKARLKAAQERQATWDDQRKRTVHRACLQRADAELAVASGPERFAASRFAEIRLKRMLSEP